MANTSILATCLDVLVQAREARVAEVDHPHFVHGSLVLHLHGNLRIDTRISACRIINRPLRWQLVLKQEQ